MLNAIGYISIRVNMIKQEEQLTAAGAKRSDRGQDQKEVTLDRLEAGRRAQATVNEWPMAVQSKSSISRPLSAASTLTGTL